MNALVLCGGGARGAYEAGVASALLQRESFDLICGSSIGAVNAALIAQGEVARLAELWQSIASRKVTPLHPALASYRTVANDLRALARDSIFRKPADLARTLRDMGRLQSPGRLRRLLGICDDRVMRAELATALAFEKIERSLVVTVTNLTLGSNDSFSHFVGPGAGERRAQFAQSESGAWRLTAETYLDAICASTAIPPAFPPVEITVDDAKTYQFNDGAVANNSPIRQAIDAGADAITLVLLQHSGLHYRDARITNFAQIAAYGLDIAQERMMEYDLKLARQINEQVHRGMAPGRRFVDIRVIGPSVPLRLPSFGFDEQARIDRVFAQGLADGTASLAVS